MEGNVLIVSSTSRLGRSPPLSRFRRIAQPRSNLSRLHRPKCSVP